MTERFIINIARFLLGGILLIFGSNYFFNFMAIQPLESEAALNFMAGLHGAVYFMPFLKAVETVMGVLLITGFYVPLVLVILMPVNLNILLFNIFLNPGSLPLSLVMMASHLYLAWVYRHHYSALFRNRL